MVSFDDLANALAHWRAQQGLAPAAAPVVATVGAPAGAASATPGLDRGYASAAPLANHAPTPPSAPVRSRNAPPSMPPPLQHVTNADDFAEVEQDVVEEDAADYVVGFNAANGAQAAGDGEFDPHATSEENATDNESATFVGRPEFRPR